MKTACIYHSVDLDGFMSAAIVKHWFDKKHKTIVKEISKDDTYTGFTNDGPNRITFIGYTYGQPIPDLSGYDKVIMVDISFPKEEMEKLHLKLCQWYKEKFIWIDHHISAIKDNGNFYDGIRDTNFAACELTWNYFFPNEPMPEIVRLLGRYDCFGHKGTDEERKVLEFQYGARQVITNYEEAYFHLKVSINGGDYKVVETIHNDGKTIYKYLCTEAKQVYKNGFPISFLNVTILEEEYVFYCINKERFNPINFGIDYHSEGYDGVASFHRTKEGKWSFSLYNDNGHVDCSLIAKRYGGGGHKGAAGFIVKDINDIIKF